MEGSLDIIQSVHSRVQNNGSENIDFEIDGEVLEDTLVTEIAAFEELGEPVDEPVVEPASAAEDICNRSLDLFIKCSYHKNPSVNVDKLRRLGLKCINVAKGLDDSESYFKPPEEMAGSPAHATSLARRR